MSRWSFLTETDRVGQEDGGRSFLVMGDDRTRSLDVSRSAFAAGLNQTVAELRRDLGPRVRIVLVEPTPELGFRAADCFARSRMWNISEVGCLGPLRTAVETRQAFARARLAEIAERYPNVEVLPVFDRLCNRERCAAMQYGEVLYFDDDHLSRQGARLVASPLRFDAVGEASPGT